MKKIILCIGLLVAFYDGYAQSAPVRMTLSRRDKPITMRIDGISADIEGYDGNELIITPVADSAETPLAVKGLKQIPLVRQEATDKYPKMTDTERGLSLTIPMGYARKILVKVPQECLVYVVSMSYMKGIKVYINNVAAVQMGAIIPQIELNNVSSFLISSGGASVGLSSSDRITLRNIRYTDQPLIVNGQPDRRDYNVSSNSATIELSVPDSIKSNIICISENGNAFSDLGVTPEPTLSARALDFAGRNGMADKLPYLKEIILNGGGIQIRATASGYGNVILKKQK